jgi:hypothetical protein
MEKGDPNYKNRVLEMHQLLKKGNKEFGYYCNYGPRAHGMKDDEENKPFYSCDTVLCPDCHAKREVKRCSVSTGRRTRNKDSIK